MNIAEYRAAIRLDISDPDDANKLLADVKLDRALTRAVADLSRFLPLEKILEVTLEKDVSAEAWTAAAAYGTYVSLANKPIKPKSETVLDDASATMTRDTDYTMDYSNGKITHISGGDIGNNEVCSISYQKSEIHVDLDSIADDLIRVVDVIYPAGNIPQTLVSFDIWGNVLVVKGGSAEGQGLLSDKEHIAIYYSAVHTVPGASTDGSYPLFLDETVILAASFYALMIISFFYNVSAKIEIGKVAALMTSIGTYRGTSATAIAAVGAILSAAETALGNVGTTITTALGYLTTGAAKIDTVNIGDEVPENYGNYGEVAVGAADVYRREGSERLNEAIAKLSEASRSNDLSDVTLRQIEYYQQNAERYMLMSERYRNEAIERRNEAFAVWRDKGQYIGDFTSVPATQPGTSASMGRGGGWGARTDRL